MESGTLYIVSTPIGNLEDITLRALRILKEVDTIACEDTRQSSILLNKYEIKKPLVSYYKEKERASGEKLIEKLEEGKNVALITDAGTPCISDPGAILVRLCRDKGIKTEVIPGASAVTAAAALVGLDNGFAFIGFLPEKNKDRQDKLRAFITLPVPAIFYVAPHSLKSDVSCILEAFGDRQAFICKELTKMFERVTETTLAELDAENARGEYVLVVMPKTNTEEILEKSILEHLQYYIELGYGKKDCIKLVASERGLNKNEVYQEALKL